MDKTTLTPKAIFDRAHEITSGADRAAYLEEACAGAPELRRKVEALLRAHEEAGSFLVKPAFEPPPTGAYLQGDTGQEQPSELDLETTRDQLRRAEGTVDQSLGTHIGPYRLIKQLGAGGMGAVYLAQQEEPVRRQVALKVIKTGMD